MLFYLKYFLVYGNMIYVSFCAMEDGVLTYFISALMGAVQGIAEFLPISSSGHLVLFQHFFGGEALGDDQLFFNVLLHFGTLVAVCVYYWKDVLGMMREFFLGIADLFRRGEKSTTPPPERRLVFLIIVATLPLFPILLVKDYVEAAMSNVTFVAVALLVTGFILFFSDRLAKGRKNERTATALDAVLVGCAQAIGTLPGISRSGITISTGMMRGFDRTYAVRFSFLMSLPAVFGATLLELKDALEVGIDMGQLPIYLVGMLVAGVVGYFAIRLVNLLASKGKFGSFAYYCWTVGLVALVASFIVK